LTLQRDRQYADSISLGRVASALLRYWWIVIIGPIAAAGAAWLLTSGRPKLYAAESKIIVQFSRADSSGTSLDLNASRDLAATYQELIKTRPTMEETARRLQLSVRPSSLAQKITVDGVRSTGILRVQARDEDPVLAAMIANTVADVFIEQTRQARLAELAAFQSAAAAQGIADVGSLTVAQIGGLNSLRVLENAEPAVAPIADNRSALVVLGGLLGLMVASGIAVLLEFLIDVVRGRERFEELFEPPVLAVLPKTGMDLSRPLDVSSDRGFEESIRVLRTNLQFVPAERRQSTILFTGSDVGVGKSTAVAHLALAIARAGKKVIVIDADMRRPTLDKMLLSERPATGLSSFLADSSLTIDNILVSTSLEGLSVIPSGPPPPNPSELLNSRRLDDLLEEATKRADYVLIDAPPTLAVADAHVVAPRTHGVVLVVDSEATRARSIAGTLQALDRVRARVLGAVINKRRYPRLGYYSGYGSYYGYGSNHTSASGDGASSASDKGEGVLSRVLRVLPGTKGRSR
jgi:non-specific protein-tyrosine kinase